MKRLLIAGCIALAGCVTAPVQPISRMAFPEAEYKALPQSGNATVRGQAFLKTRGGDVKLGAGNEVILNPVTSYSLEWHEQSYLRQTPMEKPDQRLWDYVKKEVADGNGRFTFRNVPPGEYFVTSAVTWEAPTGYKGALQMQGGTVTKRVKVDNGADIDVIVTR